MTDNQIMIGILRDSGLDPNWRPDPHRCEGFRTTQYFRASEAVAFQVVALAVRAGLNVVECSQIRCVQGGQLQAPFWELSAQGEGDRAVNCLRSESHDKAWSYSRKRATDLLSYLPNRLTSDDANYGIVVAGFLQTAFEQGVEHGRATEREACATLIETSEWPTDQPLQAIGGELRKCGPAEHWPMLPQWPVKADAPLTED